MLNGSQNSCLLVVIHFSLKIRAEQAVSAAVEAAAQPYWMPVHLSVHAQLIIQRGICMT